MRQIRYRRRYNCGAQLHYSVLSQYFIFQKEMLHFIFQCITQQITCFGPIRRAGALSFLFADKNGQRPST